MYSEYNKRTLKINGYCYLQMSYKKANLKQITHLEVGGELDTLTSHTNYACLELFQIARILLFLKGFPVQKMLIYKGLIVWLRKSFIKTSWN